MSGFIANSNPRGGAFLSRPSELADSSISQPEPSAQQEAASVEYKVEVFTGIRPTADLTVANYLGAVLPTIKLQQSGQQPLVFVADLHAMTTHSPREARAFTEGVIADYLALGLDPSKTDIFVQSAIESEILKLTFLLAKHISLAELMRVPTLKDKLRGGTAEENASLLLAEYPVMMAADILIQRARTVPVGFDQIAHIEVTRLLARRFNAEFGPVFPLPNALEREDPPRILGLQGEHKMSKSFPQDAIFLTDAPADIARKIRAAKTAMDGAMPDVLRSHIALATGLIKRDQDRAELDRIITAHVRGGKVMKDFKALLTRVVVEFVQEFQARRADIGRDPDYIHAVLAQGTKVGRANAVETMQLIEKAIYS